MIGILGGMGTQAGLDFCNKIAKINRGKLDQQYPMFVLYNKSDTPKRPENLKKYYNVLNALVDGCKICLLYTSPSPRDRTRSRMPSSA